MAVHEIMYASMHKLLYINGRDKNLLESISICALNLYLLHKIDQIIINIKAIPISIIDFVMKPADLSL